jgi:hypothetical protein
MVDPWLLRFNQQKKSGNDGEKSDKAFYAVVTFQSAPLCPR